MAISEQIREVSVIPVGGGITGSNASMFRYSKCSFYRYSIYTIKNPFW